MRVFETNEGKKSLCYIANDFYQKNKIKHYKLSTSIIKEEKIGKEVGKYLYEIFEGRDFTPQLSFRYLLN